MSNCKTDMIFWGVLKQSDEFRKKIIQNVDEVYDSCNYMIKCALQEYSVTQNSPKLLLEVAFLHLIRISS